MILRNINCLVYWIRLTVKSTLIYNRRVLLQMLRIFLNFAVMVFLWTALIENQIKVDTSLDTLILYSAVSTLISCVVQSNVISSFFQKELATGDIAMHLFRPVPLEAVAVANGIGASVTGILLYGAAFLLVLVFVLLTGMTAIRDMEAFLRLLPSIFFGEIFCAVSFGLAYLLSRGSMGAGDVKLALVMGLYLTGEYVSGAVLYGCLAAALFSLVQLARKKLGRRDKIPFVPFLYIGLIIRYIAG